jgi:hypothetical protein
MNMNVGAEGHFKLELIRGGNVIERREGRNTVVTSGKALLANRAYSDTPAVYQYMQLGTGTTAASSAQTNLVTPLASATLTARQTAETIAMSGTRTAKWEHTWTAQEFSAAGVSEVGMFNALTTSSVNMMARFVFTTVNKTQADTLKITWTLKIN